MKDRLVVAFQLSAERAHPFDVELTVLTACPPRDKEDCMRALDRQQLWRSCQEVRRFRNAEAGAGDDSEYMRKVNRRLISRLATMRFHTRPTDGVKHSESIQQFLSLLMHHMHSLIV